MKATITVIKEVTIILSGEEASWLKNYVQNNMFETEDQFSQSCREKLFGKLREVGVE